MTTGISCPPKVVYEDDDEDDEEEDDNEQAGGGPPGRLRRGCGHGRCPGRVIGRRGGQMVMARAGGHRPALGHGDGARSLAATATTTAAERATTGAWDGQEVPPPPPPTPPHFAPPPRYAQSTDVPAWAQQLWASMPLIDLVSDDDEDGDN
jgi:hypothetical protein